MTLRQTGYWRNTQTLFERALAVTRDNFVAYNNLGVVFMDEGNMAAAEQHFDEAVQINRNYAEWVGNLGLCRSREGKTAEAAAHYRAEAERCHKAALQLKPECVNSHLALGALLAAGHRDDEAMAHFRAAVQSDPQNADAQFNLAFALNGRGDHAGAAVHYAEACRLRPEDAEARSSLALALLAAGRLPEAMDQMREALRLRPDARINYYLALALGASGRLEEALPHYREAVRLSPDTPLHLNDLAWFLATNPKAELRNGTEALKLAARARDLSGAKQARFWGTLDAAYAEAGRFADALAAAATTVELTQASGQPDIAREAEVRMALYRTGKPCRRQLPADNNPPK